MKPSPLVAMSIISGVAAVTLTVLTYLNPDYFIAQAVVVTLVSLVAPIVIWHRDKRARLVEDMNGNIVKMVVSIERMSQFPKDHAGVWHSLPPSFRQNYRSLLHILSNVATISQGYRDLRFLQEEEVN